MFSTDAAAQDALLLLSAVEIADATQLPPLEVLPAKQIPERPEVLLQVRFAVESDRKERNAAQKSRFYLFHPEWDPETEEGRRRREGRDRRYRDRDERGSYRRGGRGRYDEQVQTRARNEENNSFDVDLYDDDPAALARRSRQSPRDGGRGRRRDSRSPSDDSRYDDRRRSTNRDKELFPNSRPRDALRSEGGSHARDRSASPARDHRDAMEDDLARDREAVRNNREKARSIKERIYTSRADAGTKDLFPISGGGQKKELFPETKELFPERARGGRAQMDQVSSADLIAGMAYLSYDGAVEFSDARDTTPSSFSYSPCTLTPSPRHVGRKRAVVMRDDGNSMITIFHPDDRNTDNGSISIRGLSRQSNIRDGSGMLSIKGTAKSVRELFPDKFNSSGGNNRSNSTSDNAGKELFSDRLEGRGRRRQKAGDLFD